MPRNVCHYTLQRQENSFGTNKSLANMGTAGTILRCLGVDKCVEVAFWVLRN